MHCAVSGFANIFKEPYEACCITGGRPHLKCHVASTAAEIEEHQRFRYDVFGKECGFLTEGDCPDGRDCDDFDRCSAHFMVREADSGRIVACSRLTFANPYGGSYTERFFDFPPLSCPRSAICEVNRFGISPQYRGRAGRRVRLLLFREMLAMAKERGLTQALITVHRPFGMVLRRDGVPLVPIPASIRAYSGYYSRYFDPSDNEPFRVEVAALERFLLSEMQASPA